MTKDIKQLRRESAERLRVAAEEELARRQALHEEFDIKFKESLAIYEEVRQKEKHLFKEYNAYKKKERGKL